MLTWREGREGRREKERQRQRNLRLEDEGYGGYLNDIKMRAYKG